MSNVIENTSSLLPNQILCLDQATPGTGPLGPNTDIQLSPRLDTYLTLEHNIRSKSDNLSVPIINTNQENSQQYVNDKYVNFTDREQYMPTCKQQINLKEYNVFNNLSIKDAKTTTKETTLFSASGNAERQHEGLTKYTCVDKPKTTTKQTTLFSASGNAERQSEGLTTYTYVDKPKTTTNETTLYSAVGNTNGNTSSYNQTNRSLFEGDNVTKWSQKSCTLVENFIPSPHGHTIQLNPESKIGEITNLNLDCDILNTSGPGGYTQSLPNADNFQQTTKDLIGEYKVNPYKPSDIDNRSTANYLINNLQTNDMSIYQRPELRDKKYNSPFFIDSSAQDHSGIETYPLPLKELDKYNLSQGNVNVYKNNNYNPNSTIVFNTYGQSKSNIENPLLFHGQSPKNYNTYLANGYSGTAIEGNIYDPKILLDTDSVHSSRHLNYFNSNGCLNNIIKSSDVIIPTEYSVKY